MNGRTCGIGRYRKLVLFLLVIVGCIFTESRAENDGYPYLFFTRLEVIESLTADCQMPCATPMVERVFLYLQGGFSIQGDTVVGKGSMEVRPESDCRIVAQKGGGSGSSCRIAGPKHGSFTVTGRVVEMVPVKGEIHAPKVAITLQQTQWPDLLVNFFLSMGGKAPFPVPVNHYQGSYQALTQQSGLIGRPIMVVAAHSENFISESVMAKISEKFTAQVEMESPGFHRIIKASGDFAFLKSPHPL